MPVGLEAFLMPAEDARDAQSPGSPRGPHDPEGPHDPWGPQAAPAAPDRAVVMDSADVGRALTRIAHEVVERNKGTAGLVVVGIHTRGVPLARRLGAKLAEIEGRRVPVGALDVTMYRDDIGLRPPTATRDTDLPFDLAGMVVVLVDDVLYTGRTIRAALDALTDFGRPRAIQLAVLVDRGHRELPLRADYVGKNLPTSPEAAVKVLLEETDGRDGVAILHGDAATGDGRARPDARTAEGSGEPRGGAPVDREGTRR
jgi:pyrimidine operon attenuation protein / uracil phosphoribosyltransferase